MKKLFEPERPAVGETGVRLRCLVAYPDESRLMNFEVFAVVDQNCRSTYLAAQMVRCSWQDAGEEALCWRQCNTRKEKMRSVEEEKI